MKPQRYCIFCHGAGLSKEHVWADWLKPFIRRTFSNTRHIVHFSSIDPHSDAVRRNVSKGKLDRPGHPTSQRLRVVCEKCNTGWMSRLQERSKGILLPLLRGEWWTFAEPELRTLSAWVTMFAMVYEWADELTVTSTESERLFLKNNQIPPANWRIWIGQFQGGEGECVHTGLGTRQSQVDVSSNPKCDTHINTLTIGKVLFHSFATTSNLSLEFPPVYAIGLGIVPIWPMQPFPANSPTRILNTRDALRIATTLRSVLASKIL
jgi:hypothetical protein